MCGIAALFRYGPKAPPVALDVLDKINRAMRHRGPDGGGRWVSDDGRIGLAHRRLAIIDPDARANQPMTIDQRYWITFNGEIYNFWSLRADLQSQGVNFRTESDTEVLLRLYERDGAQMIGKLRGMFAFVIWDGVNRRLFLARDAFGIKPLYFSDNGGTVQVASTVKGLKAGGEAGNVGPDPAGHVGFFLFGSVPEPHTLFSDIRALPAGHTLTIEADGRRCLEPYFDFRKALTESRNDGEQLDLRNLLVDSIRHHFVSDVPVGVFLSAGLDSASILALASESQGHELKSFTLGYDELSGTIHDEVPLAEEIAKYYGTKQKTEWITNLDFNDSFSDLMMSMDQPSIDGVNTYFVARAAARDGLKVALSGIGADELFGGYDTFLNVPKLTKSLSWIPGLSKIGRGFRIFSAAFLSTKFTPKYASLFEYGGSTAGSYFLRRGLFMPWELPRIMDPDLASVGWQSLQPLVKLETSLEGVSGSENRVRILETCFYLRNQLLRDADWAGMAHSLEIRVPFVDFDLFRALSPFFGTDFSPTKMDMADTPLSALPPVIKNKPKTGFSIPVEQWIKETKQQFEYGQELGMRGWAREVYKVQKIV